MRFEIIGVNFLVSGKCDKKNSALRKNVKVTMSLQNMYGMMGMDLYNMYPQLAALHGIYPPSLPAGKYVKYYAMFTSSLHDL